MIDFLKERIVLFVLVIAGDWVSLSTLIKADEIRHDAISIAIAVSLLPSFIISLLVEFFFQQKLAKKKLILSTAIISLFFWAGFIVFYGHFTSVNNQYGKISLPVDAESVNTKDSIIVGGCSYTAEAQAEVDDYTSKKRTLTPAMLFADFNYDISQIWAEKERDCARDRILNSFAIMLAFLIAGITLACETLIAYKKKK